VKRLILIAAGAVAADAVTNRSLAAEITGFGGICLDVRGPSANQIWMVR
jgi:hypothetical protein